MQGKDFSVALSLTSNLIYNDVIALPYFIHGAKMGDFYMFIASISKSERLGILERFCDVPSGITDNTRKLDTMLVSYNTMGAGVLTGITTKTALCLFAFIVANSLNSYLA